MGGGEQGGRSATRQRVLAAAERLFLLRGYRAVTVEDIAAKAGFSTGAVYSNFSGKADIFLALSEQRNHRQEATAREVLLEGRSDSLRLENLGRMIAREIERSREWVRAENEFLVDAVANPQLQARVHEHDRAGRRLYADFLLHCCSVLGIEPPEDPVELGVIMSSLTRGLMLEWQIHPDVDVGRLFVHVLMQLLTAESPMQDWPRTAAADPQRPVSAERGKRGSGAVAREVHDER